GTLTREVVQEAATAIAGSTTVTHYDGTEFDLGGSWDQVTLYGSLSAALGEEVTVATPRATLLRYAEKIELAVPDHAGPGKVAEELFEALVQPKLQRPTFVRDYPEETS